MYAGSGSERKGAGRVFRTVDGKESVMEVSARLGLGF